MTKFKVGDRVTPKIDSGYKDLWTHGKEYIVTCVYSESGYDRINTHVDDKGDTTNGWRSDKFELFKPKSPVREVTKKEIVPGSYGIITVFHDLTVCIGITNKQYTPQQLREAAENLIKIAEVLEENGAND